MFSVFIFIFGFVFVFVNCFVSVFVNCFGFVFVSIFAFIVDFVFTFIYVFSFVFAFVHVLVFACACVVSSAMYPPGRRCTGAGPIFDSSLDEDDPNSVPIGSLVFFNAGSDEEARETVENDPYNDAGLFDSIFVARSVRCVWSVCALKCMYE